MSHTSRQSGGGGGRRGTKDEPNGAVNAAQLNRLHTLCATHAAEEDASGPDRPVPLPENDLLFRMMESEFSRHVSIAYYERIRSYLPSIRYSFAKQFQKILSMDANGEAGIPLDWDEVRARGEAQSAVYLAKMEEEVRHQSPQMRDRDAPAREMMAKSLRLVWDRLCQQAFDSTKATGIDAKAAGTPLLAAELDAMFRADRTTYLPLVCAALSPYVGDDASSSKDEKFTFISQLMCNYLHRTLNDNGSEKRFPESWQDVDARLKMHEPGLLDFLDKESSRVGLNLIGQEKELMQLYHTIGARMKTIGRYNAAPASPGAYLN